MTDEDAHFLREQLLDVWRQLHEILTSQEALLRTFVESFPNAMDGVRFLEKYEAHKAAFSEEVLDARMGLCLHIERQWSGASESESSLFQNY